MIKMVLSVAVEDESGDIRGAERAVRAALKAGGVPGVVGVKLQEAFVDGAGMDTPDGWFYKVKAAGMVEAPTLFDAPRPAEGVSP